MLDLLSLPGSRLDTQADDPGDSYLLHVFRLPLRGSTRSLAIPSSAAQYLGSGLPKSLRLSHRDRGVAGFKSRAKSDAPWRGAQATSKGSTREGAELHTVRRVKGLSSAQHADSPSTDQHCPHHTAHTLPALPTVGCLLLPSPPGARRQLSCHDSTSPKLSCAYDILPPKQ